jgi:hypothetical protein
VSDLDDARSVITEAYSSFSREEGFREFLEEDVHGLMLRELRNVIEMLRVLEGVGV